MNNLLLSKFFAETSTVKVPTIFCQVMFLTGALAALPASTWARDDLCMNDALVAIVRRHHLDAPNAAAHRVLLPRPIGGVNSTVWKIRVEGETQVFRPMPPGDSNQIEVALKTHAASSVNQFMGLDSVPRAKFATVNGTHGVLSRWAPDSLTRIFTHWGNPTEASRLEAEAYEHLIGNEDVHLGNVNVDRAGTDRVFDHSEAFVEGLVQQRPDQIMGYGLPKKYTRRYVEGLKRLDEKALRQLTEDTLSDQQIYWVLYRRRLQLDDIKTRGAAAILEH